MRISKGMPAGSGLGSSAASAAAAAYAVNLLFDEKLSKNAPGKFRKEKFEDLCNLLGKKRQKI